MVALQSSKRLDRHHVAVGYDHDDQQHHNIGPPPPAPIHITHTFPTSRKIVKSLLSNRRGNALDSEVTICYQAPGKICEGKGEEETIQIQKLDRSSHTRPFEKDRALVVAANEDKLNAHLYLAMSSASLSFDAPTSSSTLAPAFQTWNVGMAEIPHLHAQVNGLIASR